MANLQGTLKILVGAAPPPPPPPTMSAGGHPLHPQRFLVSAGGHPLHPRLCRVANSEPVTGLKLLVWSVTPLFNFSTPFWPLSDTVAVNLT